jgi:hypothetical protein
VNGIEDFINKMDNNSAFSGEFIYRYGNDLQQEVEQKVQQDLTDILNKSFAGTGINMTGKIE